MDAATHVAVLRVDAVVLEPENGLGGKREEEWTERKDRF